MPDLEQRLSELGRRLDYPRGANLAAAVRRRIEAPAARQLLWPRPLWPRPVWPRRLVLAAAIAAVVLAALAAFPPSRNAIAGFLGLKGVIIQRVPTAPSPGAGPTGSIAQRLDLGSEVTLAQAQAAVSYHVLVPGSLGQPDHVYLVDPPSRQAVALVYLSRPGLPQSALTGVGLLLIEFPGKIDSAYIEKMVGPDATLESLRVNGQPGFWLSGAPHGLLYVDPQGNVRQDTLRLAGNTLVWNQAGLAVRIEAPVSKDQALGLAASLR